MPAAKRLSPGAWRSAARAARQPDGNVFAQLSDLATRLHDLGQDDEAETVRKAMGKARDDPEAASALLRELAGTLLRQAPAYGHGLQQLLRDLPGQAKGLPGGQVTDDDGIPGMAPH